MQNETRDKLIGFLSGKSIDTAEDVEAVADHLITHGVTVQEWISVEDRLPSREDLERSQFHNFLVVNEFGEVREAVFTGKYFAKLGSRLSGVTHWMSLPQSPKGE